MNTSIGRRFRRPGIALLVGALFTCCLMVVPQSIEPAHAAATGWCNTKTQFGTDFPAPRPDTLRYVPTHSGSTSCIMGQGSWSSGVEAMQAALHFCRGGERYPLFSSIDGIWGAETTSILLTFQRDRGITADGQYGPQTHNTLAYFAYEWERLITCNYDPPV